MRRSRAVPLRMRSLAIAASVVKTAVFRQIFDSRLPPDGLGIQAHQIQEFRGDVTPQPAEALDFVDLRETIDKYPSELSGGMRGRVGIARASVTKPPLMLYDSPTAGLDPITAYRMIALVIRQRDTRWIPPGKLQL